MGSRILRLSTVISRVGLSRSTIYASIAEMSLQKVPYTDGYVA